MFFCLVGGRPKKPKSTQVDAELFQDRNNELWALGSKNDLRMHRRSHALLEERVEAFNLLRIRLISTSLRCREAQEQAPPSDEELEHIP